MLVSVFNGIKIDAIACAVPANEVLAETIYREHGQELTDKIKKTVAVHSIRRSVRKQIASDLGYVAAKRIMDQKSIDPAGVGVLVFATQTPDYPHPPTSDILHKRLGLSFDCAAIDVNNGCAGFVYGAQVTCAMLQSFNCGYALLIVGDTSNPKNENKEFMDKRVSVPFGDGTAAILFKKDGGPHKIECSLNSNGNGYHSLIKFYGGYRGETYTESELALGNRNKGYPLMNGVEVFNFSITDVPKHINGFLEYQRKTVNDYDCVVLHQPNLFMIKQIAKKIGADIEKVPISLDRYGNTSGASIPLTLVDKYGGYAASRINALMCGFGVGLSWGTMSAEIDTDDILPMIYSDDYFEDPMLDLYEYD